METASSFGKLCSVVGSKRVVRGLGREAACERATVPASTLAALAPASPEPHQGQCSSPACLASLSAPPQLHPWRRLVSQLTSSTVLSNFYGCLLRWRNVYMGTSCVFLYVFSLKTTVFIQHLYLVCSVVLVYIPAEYALYNFSAKKTFPGVLHPRKAPFV